MLAAVECDREGADKIMYRVTEFGLCEEDVYRVRARLSRRYRGCVVSPGETAVRLKARAGMLMMIRWCWYGVVLRWY